MAQMENQNSMYGFAMSSGDGDQSYAKNSSYQRSVVDAAKQLVHKAISEHFEPANFPGTKTICITDLGCSVGSNTLIAVSNITEAIKLKYLNTNQEPIPEFHVSFSDYAANDFNTLFKFLPPNRPYYASGVPGSFYDRLFPRESLHFVHSSNSLHWLSRVPEVITDESSRAWNKGRIFHLGAGEEVLDAYERQHASDFNDFLQTRAQEVVPRGLVALIIPGRPNGLPHDRHLGNTYIDVYRRG